MTASEDERRHSWVTREDFDRLERKLDELTVWLTGNGKPEDGVLTRLKLLEMAEEKRIKHEEENVKDWKSMILPSVRDFVYAALMLGGYYVAGHALGVFH